MPEMKGFFTGKSAERLEITGKFLLAIFM